MPRSTVLWRKIKAISNHYASIKPHKRKTAAFEIWLAKAYSFNLPTDIEKRKLKVAGRFAGKSGQYTMERRLLGIVCSDHFPLRYRRSGKNYFDDEEQYDAVYLGIGKGNKRITWEFVNSILAHYGETLS